MIQFSVKAESHPLKIQLDEGIQHTRFAVLTKPKSTLSKVRRILHSLTWRIMGNLSLPFDCLFQRFRTFEGTMPRFFYCVFFYLKKPSFSWQWDYSIMYMILAAFFEYIFSGIECHICTRRLHKRGLMKPIWSFHSYVYVFSKRASISRRYFDLN